jgi:hypothetical protein
MKAKRPILIAVVLLLASVLFFISKPSVNTEDARHCALAAQFLGHTISDTHLLAYSLQCIGQKSGSPRQTDKATAFPLVLLMSRSHLLHKCSRVP